MSETAVVEYVASQGAIFDPEGRAHERIATDTGIRPRRVKGLLRRLRAAGRIGLYEEVDGAVYIVCLGADPGEPLVTPSPAPPAEEVPAVEAASPPAPPDELTTRRAARVSVSREARGRLLRGEDLTATGVAKDYNVSRSLLGMIARQMRAEGLNVVCLKGAVVGGRAAEGVYRYVGPIVEPAEPAPVPVIPQLSQAEVRLLRRLERQVAENKKLQRQLTAQGQTIEGLERQVAEDQRALAQRASEADKLHRVIGDLVVERDGLRLELDQQVTESTGLHQTIVDLERQAAKAAQDDQAYQELVEELEREVIRLRRETDELLLAAEQENAQAQQETERLKRLIAVKNGKISDLGSKMALERRRADDLTPQAASERRRANELAQEIAIERRNREDLNGKLAAAEDRAQEAEKDVKRLVKRVRELQGHNGNGNGNTVYSIGRNISEDENAALVGLKIDLSKDPDLRTPGRVDQFMRQPPSERR
jgi:hypothetical protein